MEKVTRVWFKKIVPPLNVVEILVQTLTQGKGVKRVHYFLSVEGEEHCLYVILPLEEITELFKEICRRFGAEISNPDLPKEMKETLNKVQSAPWN